MNKHNKYALLVTEYPLHTYIAEGGIDKAIHEFAKEVRKSHRKVLSRVRFLKGDYLRNDKSFKGDRIDCIVADEIAQTLLDFIKTL